MSIETETRDITAWIMEALENTPFGELNLHLIIHEGEIVSEMKSVTTKRKPIKKAQKASINR